jgi:hypothetical protein
VEDASRTRLVALAVLLAISIPLTVIAVAGSGSDDSDSGGLRVEEARGLPQLVIYLEDPADNEAATNRGRGQVAVECFDERDAVIYETRAAWPFSDTDGGKFDPHVHLSLDPDVLDRIARCRLKNTDPPLDGRKV